MNQYDRIYKLLISERKNTDPKGMAFKAGAGQPSEWGPPTKFGDTATRGSMAQGAKGARAIIRHRAETGQRLTPNRRQRAHLQYRVHQGWSGAAQTSPDQTPEQKARRAKLIQPTETEFKRNLSKSERDKDNPFRDLAIKTVLRHERHRKVKADSNRANIKHAKKGQDRRDAIRKAQEEYAEGVRKHGYVGWGVRMGRKP